MQDAIPKRFYSLDAMRGLAAIVVVISHWPQFFFSTEKFPALHPLYRDTSYISTYTATRLPFSNALFVCYNSGWLAVDLFFGLSGFIFYWLYSTKLKNSSITTWEFFVARFSRLYPLHLLTLLLIVCIQLFSQYAAGTSFFFYNHNSYFQFFLHLLLISSWGIGDHVSFNLPIWSVSVEVALYAMFFILCRFLPIRNAVLLFVSAIGLFFVFRFNTQMGHGIFSFFLGGYTYRIYTWLVSNSRTKAVLPYLFALSAIMWTAAIIATYHRGNMLESAPFFWRFTPLPAVLLFQLTILTLAVAETRRGTLGRRISMLGDISYSVYLLHFPIQLSILTAAIYFGINREVFYSHYFFFGFFTLVLTTSMISHYYFERPVQRVLRQTWGNKP